MVCIITPKDSRQLAVPVNEATKFLRYIPVPRSSHWGFGVLRTSNVRLGINRLLDRRNNDSLRHLVDI